ncbi:DUF3099 domain-containing protein [Pseudonocardia nematodicida]|uniref:DUF3099 domain-containing protein n=1 Tax=Pseudonocardia nematodicida TaxID=1206997 RepID=UPI003618A44C
MADRRRQDPVLITDAQMSYEEELAVRKRRYKWMMGMRIPCMIAAGLFYQVPWVAVTLLLISVPLPWIAVLIANDRLPRKAEKPNRYSRERNRIEARPHAVIDETAGDGTTGDGGPDAPGAAQEERPAAGSTGRPDTPGPG